MRFVGSSAQLSAPLPQAFPGTSTPPLMPAHHDGYGYGAPPFQTVMIPTSGSLTLPVNPTSGSLTLPVHGGGHFPGMYDSQVGGSRNYGGSLRVPSRRSLGNRNQAGLPGYSVGQSYHPIQQPQMSAPPPYPSIENEVQMALASLAQFPVHSSSGQSPGLIPGGVRLQRSDSNFSLASLRSELQQLEVRKDVVGGMQMSDSEYLGPSKALQRCDSNYSMSSFQQPELQRSDSEVMPPRSGLTSRSSPRLPSRRTPSMVNAAAEREAAIARFSASLQAQARYQEPTTIANGGYQNSMNRNCGGFKEPVTRLAPRMPPMTGPMSGSYAGMVQPVVTHGFVQPVLVGTTVPFAHSGQVPAIISIPARSQNLSPRLTYVRSGSPTPSRPASRPPSYVAAPLSAHERARKMKGNDYSDEGSRSLPVIAIDVDEVLVCYVDGFRKFLQRELPEGLPDNTNIFKEAHDVNSPWRMKFAMEGGLENLEAVPGAHEALRKLSAAGIRMEVVTSRPAAMQESTKVLLRKLFPPDTFSDYHFVHGGEKGQKCLQLGALALVDDQIPNAIDVLNCGLLPILFDLNGSYPWSVCGPQDLPLGVHRIETWAQTADFLVAKIENHKNVMASARQAPQTPATPTSPRTKVPVALESVGADQPRGHSSCVIARPTRAQALGGRGQDGDSSSRSPSKSPKSPRTSHPEVKKHMSPGPGKTERDFWEMRPSSHPSLTNQDPETSHPRSAVRDRMNESLRENLKESELSFAEVPTEKMPERFPRKTPVTMEQAMLWSADDGLSPTFEGFKDADDSGPPMPLSTYQAPKLNGNNPEDGDPCTIQ
mmetsp:Transcript_99868/g.177758  ORF Transcript_99868/g.177758 Transcript_99868/m.177758 type:complete len:823 (-) Transcript_99868:197-2665(-)|eukprot:CAMPEP_0197622066 /NCGR_PEP_ID=MMETSP1338-20131121/2457_1 /TAXON_ID=43686 ORGANISM="Pelagodinium beii, Strain RCC1491" /NCGR_SAMPLE_ID=MMETSP1338 /ASSEMBLY_ACC=CAM_ASM_000754 /LENGTH=822 /DNA_ID=CAMNT_0043191691 /DNA_START=46 /DNA_END=2514 /DNA_ORIENTATION=-